MVYAFWSNAALCTPICCLLVSKQGHGGDKRSAEQENPKGFSLRPNLLGFMENLFILLANTQNTFGITEFFSLSIFPSFSL